MKKHLALLMAFSGFSALSANTILNAQTDFRSENMPYEAFDKLNKTELKIQNALLKVGFAPGKLNLPQKDILNWLTNSAKVVSKYYGTFPVNSVRILIVPSNGRGIHGGQAFGYNGAAIRLFVGKESRISDLKKDWVAIHEMIHLALPNMPQRHHWLSEGLSVYIESIARVQASQLTEQQIWAEFMRDMPKGQPRTGDRGLDYTPTWGRKYWGGAMFCLLADIELRKQTNNKMGLQYAMTAVVKNGGNTEQFWPIIKVINMADKATGKRIIFEQYEKMHKTPVTTDLDNLWQQLGIEMKNGRVELNNNAPLAHIRSAIVSPLS